jgi:hypothetical protein
MFLPRPHHEDGLDLPPSADYACTTLYTHNFQAFQSITRKIEWGYPQDNYLPFAQSISSIVNFKLLIERRIQPQPLQDVLLQL